MLGLKIKVLYGVQIVTKGSGYENICKHTKQSLGVMGED